MATEGEGHGRGCWAICCLLVVLADVVARQGEARSGRGRVVHRVTAGGNRARFRWLGVAGGETGMSVGFLALRGSGVRAERTRGCRCERGQAGALARAAASCVHGDMPERRGRVLVWGVGCSFVSGAGMVGTREARGNGKT